MRRRDRTDFLALANLLVAWIQYLLIRSRTTAVYGGIPLDSDPGWERIRNTVLVAFGAAPAAGAAGGAAPPKRRALPRRS